MKTPFLIVLTAILGLAFPARAWEPAAGPLLTRWAAEVNATNCLPEYPRPQLVRPDWLNLNGLWDGAITPATAAPPTNYGFEIMVPFPVESALSGVMRRLDDKSSLWYRRGFVVPKEWDGRRVRLHFGAVDWHARVFVNGREVGQHRGGYDGFAFDITPYLNRSNREELTVEVEDPTEGDQPRGKQSRKPEGIFYTPTSGIWQTVWLEPVPDVCIDQLSVNPDVDAQALHLRAAVNSADASLRVRAVAFANGKEVGRATGPANAEFWLPVPAPRLWSPDDPFLYDLQVQIVRETNVLDAVTSYFGMRKISLQRDEGGVMRIALNGHFSFQVGALDQGFWPDGLYTAPTDEALRFDIGFLKAAGFTMARKHVKVEPERWYYWCDKLGLLVWQDMPSGNNTTPEGRSQFEVELRRMIEGRRNHPSIIVWILFNEGWGQYDTERLAGWIKAFDPARLVDDASGWTDKRAGDIIDIHSYPGPEAPPPEADRAASLGEFGGLGLGVTNHMWSTNSWGYRPMHDLKALNDEGGSLLSRLHVLRDSFGLSAAIYTQVTDVETECNGLLTYDRAVAKLDPQIARAAVNVAVNQKPFRVLAPNALYGRVQWKYTVSQPDDHWSEPDFDDSGWKQGVAGFGTKGTPGAIVNTTWDTSDIWLRREFVLATTNFYDAVLQLHHDEDVQIFLNGVPAFSQEGFLTFYDEVKIAPAALAALKVGVNAMAVHCHQSSGGQYVDVGLVAPRPNP
ncbi:MAG TPA: glycoside hydrolase family 2 TIM barrel-domain containing protein [Verrucomicrobiae bacterium]|nr:glycoside hydrolase family 2 TIM barrel-domain containing protein [Verrucomicrobiae bacterium]